MAILRFNEKSRGNKKFRFFFIFCALKYVLDHFESFPAKKLAKMFVSLIFSNLPLSRSYRGAKYEKIEARKIFFCSKIRFRAYWIVSTKNKLSIFAGFVPVWKIGIYFKRTVSRPSSLFIVFRPKKFQKILFRSDIAVFTSFSPIVYTWYCPRTRC